MPPPSSSHGWPRCLDGSTRRGLPLLAESERTGQRQRSRAGGQDLDRDLTFQLGIGRPIHLAHATFTDLGSDLVDAEAGTGGQGQK